MRKPLVPIALLALALLAAAVCASSASASGYQSQVEFWAAEASIAPPTCVQPSQMRKLTYVPPGMIVFGTTDVRTRHVYLLKSVCRDVNALAHAADDQVTGANIDALATIFHEAAHVHGVRSERLAECAGVRGALKWIAFYWPSIFPEAYQHLLVDDEQYREDAYKLRGTCHVPASLSGYVTQADATGR
jgi:hypothetical protein